MHSHVMGSSSRIRLGSKLLRVVDNRMGINGYSHRQRRAKPPNDEEEEQEEEEEEEEEDTGSVWINRRSFVAAMSDRFLHATYARSPEPGVPSCSFPYHCGHFGHF